RTDHVARRPDAGGHRTRRPQDRRRYPRPAPDDLAPCRSSDFDRGTMMTRRSARLFVPVTLVAATLTAAAQNRPSPASADAARPPFNVVEASIAEMRTAMEQGRTTSREIVQQYLARIGTYEDKLHAAITVNPNALKEADE